MPRADTAEIKSQQYDFSGAIVGSVSDAQRRVRNYVRFADNMVARPVRAMTVRGGTRDIVAAILSEPPHTLGKHYNAAANRVFVATANGATGTLWRIGSGYVRQTTPSALTGEKLDFEMANGVLIATQQGGSAVPMFYDTTNAAETWLTMTLPVPGNTLTLTAGAGGSMNVSTTYWYRLRWLYKNGSSKASTPQSVALGGAQNRVTITTIPLGSARPDYLGWTLERSKATGGVAGPYYQVVEVGTATSYVDDFADAELYERTREVLHGDPAHFDGLVFHKGYLFGWSGSSLHCSQAVGDVEGTGIFNWQADAIYDFAKDDGDEIKSCMIESDRIVVCKGHSTHVLEGDDPDSFRIRVLDGGVGAAGLRCTASRGKGGFVYAGEGGLFLLKGDKLEPWGWAEVGHYKDTIDHIYDENAGLYSYLGDFVLFSYTASPNTTPSDAIAFDLRMGNWTHFDWRIADALVQRDGSDFDRATMLYADPQRVTPAAASSTVVNPSFVSWRDDRVTNTQVYVQKLNYLGVPQWTTDGVLCGNSSGSSQSLESAVLALSDGGCIVAFTDRRGGARIDVYAQRFNSSGVAQWTAQGVAISNDATGNKNQLVICDDGSGGAIIAWTDARAGQRPYVQRINGSGVVQWTVNGIQSGTAGGSLSPQLLPDGSNGCYLSWWDSAGHFPYYQRLDSTGAAVSGWGTGVRPTLTAGASSDSSPRMCRLPTGGIMAVWLGGSNVFARRIAADATLQWAAPINVNSTQGGTPLHIALCSDASDGAFIVWGQGTPNFGAYVRRIASDGSLPWAITQLAGYAANTAGVCAVESGSAEALLGWIAPSTGADVYAAKVDQSGKLLGSGVVAVAVATGSKAGLRCCTDGGGGAIFSWSDPRGANTDVYAQRMDRVVTAQWAANGIAVVTATGTQQTPRIAFTSAPESEVPSTAQAGYHVWSAFKGLSDFADVTGANGRPIGWAFETPPCDDGRPDDEKDYKRLEVEAVAGFAQLTASIVIDGGAHTETVQLAASSQGLDYWDDGSLWDDGTHWGSSGRAIATQGLRRGLRGRDYTLRVSGQLTESIVFSGYTLDAFLLPARRM